jgi:hypothetical protein
VSVLTETPHQNSQLKPYLTDQTVKHQSVLSSHPTAETNHQNSQVKPYLTDQTVKHQSVLSSHPTAVQTETNHQNSQVNPLYPSQTVNQLFNPNSQVKPLSPSQTVNHLLNSNSQGVATPTFLGNNQPMSFNQNISTYNAPLILNYQQNIFPTMTNQLILLPALTKVHAVSRIWSDDSPKNTNQLILLPALTTNPNQQNSVAIDSAQSKAHAVSQIWSDESSKNVSLQIPVQSQQKDFQQQNSDLQNIIGSSSQHSGNESEHNSKFQNIERSISQHSGSDLGTSTDSEHSSNFQNIEVSSSQYYGSGNGNSEHNSGFHEIKRSNYHHSESVLETRINPKPVPEAKPDIQFQDEYLERFLLLQNNDKEMPSQCGCLRVNYGKSNYYYPKN